MSDAERIAKALDVAIEFSGFDGAHHKQWCIDQMVRALTGCPIVTRTTKDHRGNEYSYDTQGESDEYHAWVHAYRNPPGTEGDKYEWDKGIAP